MSGLCGQHFCCIHQTSYLSCKDDAHIVQALREVRLHRQGSRIALHGFIQIVTLLRFVRM